MWIIPGAGGDEGVAPGAGLRRGALGSFLVALCVRTFATCRCVSLNSRDSRSTEVLIWTWSTWARGAGGQGGLGLGWGNGVRVGRGFGAGGWRALL
jgi:hypothetical protein